MSYILFGIVVGAYAIINVLAFILNIKLNNNVYKAFAYSSATILPGPGSLSRDSHIRTAEEVFAKRNILIE